MLMDGDVVLAQNNGQKSIAKINQYHKGESTGNYILSSTFYIIFYNMESLLYKINFVLYVVN